MVELFVREELGVKSVLTPKTELHPSPLWGEEAALVASSHVPYREVRGGGTLAPDWAVRLLRSIPCGYRAALLDRAAADPEFRAAALAVLALSASWADGAEHLVELVRGTWWSSCGAARDRPHDE
jgi:hypothetical protein